MSNITIALLQATLTALHVAAREGHIEVVRALCVAGADISATTKVRLCHTPLTNSHLSNLEAALARARRRHLPERLESNAFFRLIVA